MPVAGERVLALSLALALAGACGVEPALGADAVAASPSPAPASDAYQRAPLTLIVNGIDAGVTVVLLRGGDVLVRLEDVQKTSIPASGATTVDVDGVQYVSLASLAPKIAYNVDQANLTLNVTLDPSLLPNSSTSLALPRSSELARSDASGFLNYSLTTNDAPGEPAFEAQSSSGFFQMGVGGGADLLTATGSWSDGRWERGLTAYQIESQANLTRLTVGEEVASTGMLGGGVVVAGLGSSRHFEFQPDYVFFPTAGVSGTVLAPTTADVYVNGSFLRSVQLPPGQFNLSDIPVPVGSNVTQVILHDASGNTQTLNGSFYSTQELLRKGLTDFNYHVGFLRADPFGTEDRYGPLAALGTYRLGLTNFVTAGARIEQSKQLTSGGPELDLALPAGQLALEAGFSTAAGTSGNAFGAAYTLQDRGFAIDLSAQAMSANYATASLAPSAPRTRSAVLETLSLPLGNAATLSLSHSTTTSTNLGTSDHLAATTTVRLAPDVAINLNAARDRGGSFLGFAVPGSTGNRWTVGSTLTLLLGRQSNLFVDSTQSGGSNSTDVTLIKNTPTQLGFGYTLRGSSGPTGSAAASLAYHTQAANLQLLASDGGGVGANASATVAGSVVGFKQGLFFAPPTGTGYALAETKNFPGTQVFEGDQYAGRTDGHGDLVVGNLAAYGANTLGVDEMRDRIDVVEDASSIVVKPKIYSGVVAPFSIRTFRVYLGRIVVRRGDATVVPAFGMLTLRINGIDYASDLGSEGQFYFDGPTGGAYQGTVLASGLQCTFAGVLPEATETVTRLGTLTCQAK